MGLTRLSLYTTPPTPHHRNSTSTRNNDRRGLKFCRRPYQAKLTTIQHNFNPAIFWGGGAYILHLGLTLPFKQKKFGSKSSWPKFFYPEIFLPKIFSDPKFLRPKKLLTQNYFYKIFFYPNFFWPKYFLIQKIFFTEIFLTQ